MFRVNDEVFCYTERVKKIFWIGLFGVLFLLVCLAVVLGLSYKKVECVGFKERDSQVDSACGLWRRTQKMANGDEYLKYVALGKVMGVERRGKDLLVKTRISLGSGFSFAQKFRLVPRQDGRFEISEERRKWLGYFDNGRVTRWSPDRSEDLEKELKGKTVMITFMDKATNESVFRAWFGKVEKWQTNFGRIMLMIEGLLGAGTLDALQTGY